MTTPHSEGTFGNLENDLLADGVPVVYFFDNCVEGPNSQIEDLGNVLGKVLNLIRYDTGAVVPQVDLVGHSMGGLIARAYLAGLQADGSLSPPADPRVRKFIEVATPNFGSFVAPSVGGIQAAEMVPGSQFLWRLATWNQFADDLRGVDALALVGASSAIPLTNGSDGVVSLTSGSLGFTRDPSKTRILPYCHTDLNGITAGIPAALLQCTATGIAKAWETDAIVLSFLADTSAWQSIGATTPLIDPLLSKYGGMYFGFGYQNSPGKLISDLTGVSFGNNSLSPGGVPGLVTGGAPSGAFYHEFVTSGTGTFRLTSISAGSVNCGPVNEPAGYTTVWRCKYGPLVSSVRPLLGNVRGTVVQSGATITIAGSQFGQLCSNCGVFAGSASLKVVSWTDQAITAVLPATFSGFVGLVVQAASGSDAINIMAAAPTAPVQSFTVAPQVLQFSYANGSNPPPAQSIQIVSNTGIRAAYLAASSATWLDVTRAVGEIPSSLTVSVKPFGLAPGTYTGSISLEISSVPETKDPLTVSVTLVVGAAAPIITKVVNAFGDNPTISPNTWVVIKGMNLAPKERVWLDSDFVNNRMPVALDGVAVTMNGKNAYLYYISANQLNVLTPPDLTLGTVQVQVTNNGAVSGTFTVQVQQYSPSFFVFDGTHVTGTHVDGSLLGPTSLYPGFSTPAKPNETLILYANGFGPTSSPVVSGSLVQSGDLPVLPVIRIGGIAASVQFAGLVSPGLYQFNVVVPPSVPNGDNVLTATHNGLTTQAAVFISVAALGPLATDMQFVSLSAGEFMMGCSPGDRECGSNEYPAHMVRLTKGFDIGKFPVTQAEWKAVMGSIPSSVFSLSIRGDDYPVDNVTPSTAQEFLKRLNLRNDGFLYRLPTEAEWEYAARAGTTDSRYGYTVTDVGWYADNSGKQMHPVGQKKPNAWGLYDMLGNVWELCQDWFGAYSSSPTTDPKGPPPSIILPGNQVLRGGSSISSSFDLRVSSRTPAGVLFFDYDGLRLVRERFP